MDYYCPPDWSKIEFGGVFDFKRPSTSANLVMLSCEVAKAFQWHGGQCWEDDG